MLSDREELRGLMEENCGRNGVECGVEVFNWGEGRREEGSEEIEGDLLVVVSECIIPKLYPIPPLAKAIKHLLASNRHPHDSRIAVVGLII